MNRKGILVLTAVAAISAATGFYFGHKDGKTLVPTLDQSQTQEQRALRTASAYAHSISCQIEEPVALVKIRNGESDGLDAQYFAYWNGDEGCSGGNGSISGNYALIQQSGFSSEDPVVITSAKIPKMPLNYAKNAYVEGGNLVVSGIVYGDNDEQGNPTKAKTYKVPLKRFE